MSKLLLSDLNDRAPEFHPGDRVLVRTSTELSKEQHHKMSRAIKKFTGEDVRLLIVNCNQLKIILIRGETKIDLVVPEHAQHQDKNTAVANVGCSVIDMFANDQLVITPFWVLTRLQYLQIKKQMEEWVGDDIEVVIDGKTE